MKKLSHMYLIMIVMGILTSIPIIGNLVNPYHIITILLLIGSIYLLKKYPEGMNQKAACLMSISSLLYLALFLSVVMKLTRLPQTAMIFFNFFPWFLKMKSVVCFVNLYEQQENYRFKIFFGRHQNEFISLVICTLFLNAAALIKTHIKINEEMTLLLPYRQAHTMNELSIAMDQMMLGLITLGLYVLAVFILYLTYKMIKNKPNSYKTYFVLLLINSVSIYVTFYSLYLGDQSETSDSLVLSYVLLVVSIIIYSSIILKQFNDGGKIKKRYKHASRALVSEE